MDLSPVDSASIMPTTRYALFCDLHKTMGVIPAAIQAIKISHGAAKLVEAASTQVQTLEATLIYRAYKEAKELPSLQSGLDHFLARVEEFKTQYATCFPTGFKRDMINHHAVKLFLNHARIAPHSKSGIEKCVALFASKGITLSYETLRNAYATDEACQRVALGKLSLLYDRIFALEDKKIAPLKGRQLERISLLEKEIASLEKAYIKAAEKVERAVQNEGEFSEEEDRDWEEYQSTHQRLLQAKIEYDTAVDYPLYLNQYVHTLGSDLARINRLKNEFADYQAPFIGRGGPSDILSLSPRPRLDDTSNSERLPGLGNLHDVIQGLLKALKDEAQPVLASRLYYRLAHFQSPFSHQSNALNALQSLIGAEEDIDPSNVFLNQNKTHKSLLINALERLNRALIS